MDNRLTVLCPVCLGPVTYESALRYVPKIDSNGNYERNEDDQIEFEPRPQGEIDPATMYRPGGVGGGVQFETRYARPLQCPHKYDVFGDEQKRHDLPEGIFERSSTVIGFVGPTGSAKSTLLALTAHHLEGSKPRAFRAAGLYMTIPPPRIAYEKHYGDLTRLGKKLEATPKDQSLPWVTVKVTDEFGIESNLLFCDSAGENFDGRPDDNGHESAGAAHMPFLVNARVFVICVSPEYLDLELAEPADGDQARRNRQLYGDVERGIGFLIETQDRLRERLPARERNFELPWVCIVITKVDELGDGRYVDTGPELSDEYFTTSLNVRYRGLDEELARIRKESRAVRHWLQRENIEVFDQIERRCLTDLYADHERHGNPGDAHASVNALFSGISYHAVVVREGGANDNGLYEPRTRHSRLLDPMVVALGLDRKSRATEKIEGQPQ